MPAAIAPPWSAQFAPFATLALFAMSQLPAIDAAAAPRAARPSFTLLAVTVALAPFTGQPIAAAAAAFFAQAARIAGVHCAAVAAGQPAAAASAAVLDPGRMAEQ